MDLYRALRRPQRVPVFLFGWTVGEAEAFRLLDAFSAGGFNCVDTADVYPKWVPGNKGGESEVIIGNWLKRSRKRKKIIIATKVGMEMGPRKKGLSKKYILKAAEDSLRRLKTDYIDLYQSHADDVSVPLEETLEAYARLVKQGKVRAIGASNYGAARLTEALEASARNGLPAYQALQPLYNLYDRAGFETELQPVCLELGLGVICYYSLASGFLSGKYRTKADLKKSPRGERVFRYLDERGLRILKALDAAAKRRRCRPAAAALAWLMARPGVTAPIASATSVEQLEELMGAARLELSPEDMEALDKASAYAIPLGAK